jgi:hypothetical protein
MATALAIRARWVTSTPGREARAARRELQVAGAVRLDDRQGSAPAASGRSASTPAKDSGVLAAISGSQAAIEAGPIRILALAEASMRAICSI